MRKEPQGKTAVNSGRFRRPNQLQLFDQHTKLATYIELPNRAQEGGPNFVGYLFVAHSRDLATPRCPSLRVPLQHRLVSGRVLGSDT